MKRGELSINVIVVAAIALLVLVVLSVIFLGKLGIFSVKIKDCTTVGGTCDQGSECDDGYRQHPEAACYEDGRIDPGRKCCYQLEA